MMARSAAGFFGTVRSYQTSGFTLSESTYRPDSRLPWHSHDRHYFGLALRGRYRERHEKGSRDCEPMMVIGHPAGERHAQFFHTAAVQLFRIEVGDERARQLAAAGVSFSGGEFRGGVVASLALRLYREFQRPDSITPLAVEGLALELIAASSRALPLASSTRRAEPKRWLADARELIQARFSEPLSLADLARELGVHPVTLSREFRRQYGATMSEFVRSERLGFACRQLARSDASMSDIAAAAGFCDQSHLARAFRRRLMMTPAEYRRASRG